MAQEYEVIAAAVAAEGGGGMAAESPVKAAGLPATVMLESLGAAELRVKSPIEVAVFAEGGQVVAAAAGLDEFGFGDDLPAAIGDLQAALADLYFTLEAEQGHLGKGLRRVWQGLQDKVERQ